MLEKLSDPNRHDPFTESKINLLKAVRVTASSGQPQRLVLTLKDYGRPLPIDEKLEEEIDDSIIHVLRPTRTIITSDDITLEDGSVLQTRITTYEVLWDGRLVSIVKIQDFHRPSPYSRADKRLNTSYSTETVTLETRHGDSSGNPR